MDNKRIIRVLETTREYIGEHLPGAAGRASPRALHPEKMPFKNFLVFADT